MDHRTVSQGFELLRIVAGPPARGRSARPARQRADGVAAGPRGGSVACLPSGGPEPGDHHRAGELSFRTHRRRSQSRMMRRLPVSRKTLRTQPGAPDPVPAERPRAPRGPKFDPFGPSLKMPIAEAAPGRLSGRRRAACATAGGSASEPAMACAIEGPSLARRVWPWDQAPSEDRGHGNRRPSGRTGQRSRSSTKRSIFAVFMLRR